MYLKQVPFGDICGVALSTNKERMEQTYDGRAYKVSPTKYVVGGTYALMHTYDYVNMQVLGTLCLTD